MIESHLVEQVEQLLAKGKLSHRKIARITGVSRGTIGAIASGRRCIRPRPAWPWDDESLVHDVPPQRCPDCGGMVYMPCRACRTRKEMEKLAADWVLIGPHPNPLPKVEGTIISNPLPKGEGTRRGNVREPYILLGLNLKPVHQERYEEVRRWRREQQKDSGFRAQVWS
jgi:hypothetical protein